MLRSRPSRRWASCLLYTSVSRRFAIVYANRYMIAHSDWLIAYVTHAGSNAARYLAVAQARLGELRVENLGEVPPLSQLR